ncbi:type II toxin-antitoxin system PemK/MazF family toxin [Kitasatospora purpeofusca]|uniref:Type II toxin-antitoxin system PemK/MazF family toxin n=1 Tax=Kitasatospora purpeofusca TaxID=67352 RepID=A0ABZ1UAE4_9ACTN|nr:type II toxin-antitoxin system PemK/MazF family toxin [Kitasatospora purpeofusca]
MTSLRRGDVIVVGRDGMGGMWVVISNDTRNAVLDTVVVAQIGTGSDEWPTAVSIGAHQGCTVEDVAGHVLADFVTTIRPGLYDVEVQEKRLDERTMHAVSERLRLALP